MVPRSWIAGGCSIDWKQPGAHQLPVRLIFDGGFDADDIEMYVRDHHAVGCFPTHDRLTLIAVLWPCSQFREIRIDIERHVKKALESTPTVARRLEGARREEKWSGTAGFPSFFRRPFGPGWALVGDAAYNKDPITAQGISDAFIDGGTGNSPPRWLVGPAPARRGLDGNQTTRDRRVKPMYEFTSQLATLEPPAPLMRRLFLRCTVIRRPPISSFRRSPDHVCFPSS
jgi:2-polyprenyl-6-methoxyphenol hydroxylase-like FAD-dependent oxidoreductase